MEESEQNIRSPNPKKPSICEECKANPSKYTCPGCSIRSCSLACVKSHKQTSGCTGKRSLTHFVPLSQFTDNLLLSDYNLLEEVKRVAESAKRMRVKLCGNAFPFKFPRHLYDLQNASARRRTRLLLLPLGMSKRQRNRTRLNQRKKTISWTIEWRFHSTDVVLLDHNVYEYSDLRSVIENHLKSGPWDHPLRQFCEEQLDCLKFFIRKYPKGPKSEYRELDINAPLSHQLSNLVILEYPSIHVFLPSHNIDFEIDKNKITNPFPHRPDTKDPIAITKDEESQKGVFFREEEIEEDDISPGPTVCDKPIEFKELDFHFEQELLDVYTDLIAEINPDGFLDFEGGVDPDDEPGGKTGILNLGGDFEEEELEEGEIR